LPRFAASRFSYNAFAFRCCGVFACAYMSDATSDWMTMSQIHEERKGIIFETELLEGEMEVLDILKKITYFR
jgi:hypothetical protein